MNSLLPGLTKRHRCSSLQVVVLSETKGCSARSPAWGILPVSAALRLLAVYIALSWPHCRFSRSSQTTRCTTCGTCTTGRRKSRCRAGGFCSRRRGHMGLAQQACRRHHSLCRPCARDSLVRSAHVSGRLCCSRSGESQAPEVDVCFGTSQTNC